MQNTTQNTAQQIASIVNTAINSKALLQNTNSTSVNIANNAQQIASIVNTALNSAQAQAAMQNAIVMHTQQNAQKSKTVCMLIAAAKAQHANITCAQTLYAVVFAQVHTQVMQLSAYTMQHNNTQFLSASLAQTYIKNNYSKTAALAVS